MRMSRKQKAIHKINEHGALLVFPVKNQKEPHSLWSVLHPNKPMVWEWNEDADDSIPFLWHLMKELSAEGEVIYSKWYKDRATFFSRDLFTHLLAYSLTSLPQRLSPSSQLILDELMNNSPMSTKEIKSVTNLQGKLLASEYQKSLKALFRLFLIVGYGEVDDGAFPSAAIGATALIYEDLWLQAQNISAAKAQLEIDKYMSASTNFGKYLNRVARQLKNSK